MRKLAIGALSFSAAVFLANYILPIGWLLALGIAVFFGAAVLLSMRRKWLRGAVIALFACGLGLFSFYIHALQTSIPAKLLDGQTKEVTVKLLDYPQVYDRYTRATVRILSDDLPHLNMLVYDYSGVLSDCEPGQLLRFEAALSQADHLYGEDYDYYHTKNIFLKGNVRSGMELLPSERGWSVLPTLVGHRLSQLVQEIFPTDTSDFMRALLLGDKTDLYQNTNLYASMSRAGLMHIVAVSGMHVSFLVSFLQTLLGRNRRSSLLCILLVWFFVMATGSGPSAVRAGVMQTMLLFAPLVQRENDSVTSLSAALALLLLWNPYSAGSVSLQLSFAAVAGILCLGERLQNSLMALIPEGLARRLLRTPCSVLSMSLGVMAFTVPLMALHFGSVSVLAPLSNVLCLWAVSLTFCGDLAACAGALLFRPLGIVLARLVSWLARFVLLTVRLISGCSLAVVYLQLRGFVLWLVLTYLLFLVYAVSKLRIWRKLLYPALLSALCLMITTSASYLWYSSGTGTIGVLDVGQGQCISVISKDQTLLIDCGGLWSLDNAGETAGAYLLSRGRSHVDALIITHLDSDHVNGIPMLLELMRVDRILLPKDADTGNGMLQIVRASAEQHGTELFYLEEDTLLSLGEIQMQLYAPDPASGGNDHGISALISLGEYDMLVTGDSSAAREAALLEKYALQDLELLVVGHHGSKYSTSEVLLRSIGADTAVISVGYNTYGHPHEDTLERLRDYGYTLLRTDQNHTIEIQVE